MYVRTCVVDSILYIYTCCRVYTYTYMCIEPKAILETWVSVLIAYIVRHVYCSTVSPSRSPPPHLVYLINYRPDESFASHVHHLLATARCPLQSPGAGLPGGDDRCRKPHLWTHTVFCLTTDSSRCGQDKEEANNRGRGGDWG